MPSHYQWPIDGPTDVIPESWRIMERDYNRILVEAIENYIDYLDYKLGRLPERYTDDE